MNARDNGNGFGNGAVEVWCWSVVPKDACSLWLAEHAEQAERVRARRFLSPDHASRFLSAHGGLRLVLSRRLGCSPGDLRFEAEADGKPRLRAPDDAEAPLFNLSHSGDVAMLAISDSRDVGVDVELQKPIEPALARRFFHTGEADHIERCSVEQREEAFFSIWCAKEAVVKATGEGIRRGLGTFRVDPVLAGGCHGVRLHGAGGQQLVVHLRPLDLSGLTRALGVSGSYNGAIAMVGDCAFDPPAVNFLQRGAAFA